MGAVINPDQVAYLKDRFIGQNIRTIIDVMGYTKLMDKEGIIIFLDLYIFLFSSKTKLLHTEHLSVSLRFILFKYRLHGIKL